LFESCDQSGLVQILGALNNLINMWGTAKSPMVLAHMERMSE
jgi:hypothetical protein